MHGKKLFLILFFKIDADAVKNIFVGANADAVNFLLLTLQ